MEQLLAAPAEPPAPAGKDKSPAARKGPWDDQAYAAYVVMRLAYRRCEEETLPFS